MRPPEIVASPGPISCTPDAHPEVVSTNNGSACEDAAIRSSPPTSPIHWHLFAATVWSMMRTRLAVAMVTTSTADTTRIATTEHLGFTEQDLVVRDRGRSPITNTMAAWRAVFVNPDTTHALVIHDNLRAPTRWRDVVELFIERFPQQHAISFSSNRKAATPEADTPCGHFMLPGGEWRGDDALLLRRDALQGFAGWIADGGHESAVSSRDSRHHDRLLSAFLHRRRMNVMVCAPSLFLRPDPWAETPIAADMHVRGEALRYFQRRLAPRDLLRAVANLDKM